MSWRRSSGTTAKSGRHGGSPAPSAGRGGRSPSRPRASCGGWSAPWWARGARSGSTRRRGFSRPAHRGQRGAGGAGGLHPAGRGPAGERRPAGHHLLPQPARTGSSRIPCATSPRARSTRSRGARASETRLIEVLTRKPVRPDRGRGRLQPALALRPAAGGPEALRRCATRTPSGGRWPTPISCASATGAAARAGRWSCWSCSARRRSAGVHLDPSRSDAHRLPHRPAGAGAHRADARGAPAPAGGGLPGRARRRSSGGPSRSCGMQAPALEQVVFWEELP